ncbi:hypothetical protein N9Y26_00190 [bacterium]|nr:hypothetical protein [bacterium]
MIGLSTTIFKSAGKKLVNLFGSLASRSTYVENVPDSLSEKNLIEDFGILDKASILLTPTATSNARVHCVKPSLPDYGKNLISNSDDASNWTILNSSGTIVNENEYLKLTDTSGAFGYAYIPITVETGKDYIITYNLVDSGTSSSNYARIGNGINTSNYHAESGFTDTGKRTIRISPSETTIYITLISGMGINKYAYWTDITVQATADFDFDRASSATRINSSGLVQDMQSITDPELVLNGGFEDIGPNKVVPNAGPSNTANAFTQYSNNTIEYDGSNTIITRVNDSSGGYAYLNSSYSIPGNLQVDKSYKLSITFKVSSGGSVGWIFHNGVNGQDKYSFGHENTEFITITKYIHARSDGGCFIRTYNLSGSVTISGYTVQEIDNNNRWSVANSDANNYVEFTEGFARLKFLNTSPITTLSSTLTLEQDKTYELVVDVHDVTSGAIKIDAAGLSELFNAEGVTTRYLKPTGNTTLSFYRATSDVDITLASVSVKDITFSTDVDLARISYDSNGDNGHILLEPTSTNLITYSEDFSDSSWAKTDCTINSNNSISPEGTQNADKLDFTTSSGEIVRTTSFVSGQEYTMSFYAKTESGTLDFNYGNMDYTMNSGTATTEWQRFEITQTLPSATRFPKIQTTEIGSLLLWGFQIEQLSYATSYIPTYGSTVTRAAETLTGSGNSTLINSTEGVLYAEIAALAEDGIKKYISLSDGSTNNDVRLYFDTNGYISALSKVGGSTQVFIQSNAYTQTDFNKVAFKYKVNDFALWINGVEVATDNSGTTNTANSLDELNFNGNNLNFYGKCKSLAVFNEALSDDELELLTGVTNYGSFGALATADGYTII